MPMLRAVPAMTRNAASSEVAFKSFIFILTISKTCLRLTLPTLSLFGIFEPEAMPAAFLSKMEAGGDLVIKVKDLSAKTVMTTGMIMPDCSRVAALNSLQKAMMFTPCWPRAGPTGGAGLACPAGICSLICPVIFFAINLGFLHLPVLEFDRRIAAKNIDGHLQFPAFGFDLFNHAAKIQKRPVVDLDGLARFKVNLRLLRFLGFRDLRLDRGDFVRGHRNRAVSAHDANFTRRVLYKIPRLLQNPVPLIHQDHVNINVARMQLAAGDGFLAAPHINHFLDRDKDLFNILAHLFRFEALFDVLLDLLLLAGQSMDDKPLAF